MSHNQNLDHFNVKIRFRLFRILNVCFFESLWLEISGLSVKILINASYCPNKNFGNYFIDESTSETSSAYSITDEVLLFRDYDFNYFNKLESTLSDEFASNSGLTLSNTEKLTRATSQGVTLIDHGYSTKNQIQEVQIFPHQLKRISWLFFTLPSFLLNLEIGSKSFSSRNKRKFDANKFSLDLSNQDWIYLYQCEDGNGMYNVFINVFSTTQSCTPHLWKVFNQKEKLLKNLG